MDRLALHIESLIFTSERTISLEQIKTCVEETLEQTYKNVEIKKAIDLLIEKYKSDDFSFEIVEIASGFKFLTKGSYHNTVGTLIKKNNQKRLSKAALETLSIIAYKQPVTKSDVEGVRGVNCDYTIQKLLEKELVAISGRAEGPGRPLLYMTSTKFMDYFGIKDIDSLPKLKDIKVPEIQIGEPAPIEEDYADAVDPDQDDTHETAEIVESEQEGQKNEQNLDKEIEITEEQHESQEDSEVNLDPDEDRILQHPAVIDKASSFDEDLDEDLDETSMDTNAEDDSAIMADRVEDGLPDSEAVVDHESLGDEDIVEVNSHSESEDGSVISADRAEDAMSEGDIKQTTSVSEGEEAEGNSADWTDNAITLTEAIVGREYTIEQDSNIDPSDSDHEDSVDIIAHQSKDDIVITEADPEPIERILVKEEDHNTNENIPDEEE